MTNRVQISHANTTLYVQQPRIDSNIQWNCEFNKQDQAKHFHSINFARNTTPKDNNLFLINNCAQSEKFCLTKSYTNNKRKVIPARQSPKFTSSFKYTNNGHNEKTFSTMSPSVPIQPLPPGSLLNSEKTTTGTKHQQHFAYELRFVPGASSRFRAPSPE